MSDKLHNIISCDLVTPEGGIEAIRIGVERAHIHELAGLAEQLANIHIGDRDELGTIAEKILKITNSMKD